MRIFNEINSNKNLSLAFGFFDGVHIGHQAVIKSAVDFAKENNTKSAVITFQDHPCCFFYHIKPKYIITKHDKIKLFENLGIDYLYFLKFDEYLAMMNASEYLQNIIIKNFTPVAISTGFNHSFGAKKIGDVNFLNKMQEELNYKYFEVAPILYNSEVISSTRIRDDISLGNIELVNSMLGYNYFLEETVIEGQKLGRKIGFKTANLLYPEDLVEIGRGVYKVLVEYNGETFDGVANYGLRPTVSINEKSALEVHILNFDKEIYGEKIKVTFLNKIRNEKKFDSLNELKIQIKKDILNLLSISNPEGE
jgi:riboflavin kinase/FMN adenylyltransferase